MPNTAMPDKPKEKAAPRVNERVVQATADAQKRLAARRRKPMQISAEKLLIARRRSGLTQTAIALLMDWTESTASYLGKLERYGGVVNLDSAAKLALILGVPLKEIVTDDWPEVFG
jgi:hypothetical protein